MRKLISWTSQKDKDFISFVHDVTQKMPCDINGYQLTKRLRFVENFRPLRATFLAKGNDSTAPLCVVKFYRNDWQLTRSLSNYHELKSRGLIVPELLETFHIDSVNACVYTHVKGIPISGEERPRRMVKAIIELSKKGIVKDCAHSNFIFAHNGKTTHIDFDDGASTAPFTAFYLNLSSLIPFLFFNPERGRDALVNALNEVEEFEFPRYRPALLSTLNRIDSMGNRFYVKKKSFMVLIKAFTLLGPLKQIFRR